MDHERYLKISQVIILCGSVGDCAGCMDEGMAGAMTTSLSPNASLHMKGAGQGLDKRLVVVIEPSLMQQ